MKGETLTHFGASCAAWITWFSGPRKIAPCGAALFIGIAHTAGLRAAFVFHAHTAGFHRAIAFRFCAPLSGCLLAGFGVPLLRERPLSLLLSACLCLFVAGALGLLALFPLSLLGDALRPGLFALRVALRALGLLLPAASRLGWLGAASPLGLCPVIAVDCGRAWLRPTLTPLLAGLRGLRGLILARLVRPFFITRAAAFAAPWTFVLLVPLRLLRAHGRRHGQQSADHHRE